MSFLFSSIFFIIFLIFLVGIVTWFYSTDDLYYKLILYWCNILYFVGIGLYYGLDVLMLVFITAQLLVFLIFLAFIFQVTLHNNIQSSNYQNLTILGLVAGLFFSTTHVSLVLFDYTQIYTLEYDLDLNDFYFFFYFFFEEFCLVTYVLVCLLFLFSFFFILFFHSLNFLNNRDINTNNLLNFLNKQHAGHQTIYQSRVNIFSNNIMNFPPVIL